jgi:hypothetical protein
MRISRFTFTKENEKRKNTKVITLTFQLNMKAGEKTQTFDVCKLGGIGYRITGRLFHVV